jgi:hypothetical protein
MKPPKNWWGATNVTSSSISPVRADRIKHYQNHTSAIPALPDWACDSLTRAACHRTPVFLNTTLLQELFLGASQALTPWCSFNTNDHR